MAKVWTPQEVESHVTHALLAIEIPNIKHSVKLSVNESLPRIAVTIHYAYNFGELIVEAYSRFGWRTRRLDQNVRVSGSVGELPSNVVQDLIVLLQSALKINRLIGPILSIWKNQQDVQVAEEEESARIRIQQIINSEPKGGQLGRSPTRWDNSVGRKVWEKSKGIGEVISYSPRTLKVTIHWTIDDTETIVKRHVTKAEYKWFKP